MKNFKEYSFGGGSMGSYRPMGDLGDFAGKSYFGGLYASADRKITQSDLDQVERYADRLFAALGIDVEFTKHFMDRVNDARNIKQITVAELIRLFKQAHRRYGKKIAKMSDQANAVINDMKTDINMPFVIDVDRKGDMELIAKTVMRKKNFTTSASSPKLAFEEPRIPRKKGQPAKSDKHSDLYTDEDPRGTIHGLGFKDVKTAEASVAKIKKSDRTHAHKIQAAIAMEQRARVMGKTAEAAVYRKYINQMKKKTKKMNEDKHGFDCPPGYKFDNELMTCVPKKTRFKTLRIYPYFLSRKDTSSDQQTDQSQSDQSASGNGNGNGQGSNGAGNGNGGNGGTSEVYLAADVRKMPGGGFGVYADKFVKGKRVMTPGGKHQKELKKVYKNKKDANDYMAAIMIAKGGG